MTLHADLIHDDDIAVAGTNLAASDFPDGGDIVIEREVGGQLWLPTLHDVVGAVFDTVAADQGVVSRLDIQPNTWPESRALSDYAERGQLILTDSGAATLNARALGDKHYRLPRAYNIPLSKSMNLINAGNSRMFAGVANEDLAFLLYYSYGPPFPVPSAGRRLLVRKAAGGDQTAADIWSGDANGNGGFRELLSDESPGLDPQLRYLVAGLGLEPQGVSDDILIAGRVRGAGSPELWAAGHGPGDAMESYFTEFSYDTVLLDGATPVAGQSYAAAVHTPTFILEVLDAALPSDGAGGRGGGIGVPTPPPGGRAGFLPSLPPMPRFGGLFGR